MTHGCRRWPSAYASVAGMKDLEPWIDIASALQALIEAVQEHEDWMEPAKRAALQRARRYRGELMAWVDGQRS